MFVLLLGLGACGGASSSGPGATSGPPVSGDTTPPTVSITSPTTTGNFPTASAAVSLAGSASDDVGVASVSWRNALNNTSGTATSTTSWSIPSIALVSGVNTITVTARDATGHTGTATLAVTYNPGGTVSLSGNVDSSLINRSDSAVNTVYLYNGTVTPTAAVQPVATTPVTQNSGACTFSYRFGPIQAGSYTLAFSGDGVTFRGTTVVTLPGTQDFLPNRRLQVGPMRAGVNAFPVPSAAIAAAHAGDVIEIDAGEYVDDNAVWPVSNLTLRGVGGRAHMRSTQFIGNGKGIWVTSNNATVENIEFSGAAISVADGENAAGIRADGSGLTVCNGYFHNNQNGILDGNGVVLVEYSEFDQNGHCPDPATGNGCTHNMYFSENVSRFTLRYSYSHRAHEGHLVKSRAQENHILYNRIMDETGDASYEIDLPQTGRSFIIGNLIQKGTTVNNSGVISFGVENANNLVHELYVVNNTIVNDSGASAQFLSLGGGFTPTIKLVNNIFAGSGSVPSGAGITSTNNLASSSAAVLGLPNRAGFDYHLSSTSQAINAGTDPGTAGSVSLTPTSQYVYPISREDRAVNAPIDIGAYEFQ
ncbi:MAG TPA: hypothetical protein VK572_00310 [Burkholderiales bacterium]|nr:hypothetical protein [Burkholderiales bacterium]